MCLNTAELGSMWVKNGIEYSGVEENREYVIIQAQKLISHVCVCVYIKLKEF
jgi:hypothetical protein